MNGWYSLLVTAVDAWKLGAAQLIEVPCWFSLPSRTSLINSSWPAPYMATENTKSLRCILDAIWFSFVKGLSLQLRRQGKLLWAPGTLLLVPSWALLWRVPLILKEKSACSSSLCWRRAQITWKNAYKGDQNRRSFPREKRLLTYSLLEGVWSPPRSITQALQLRGRVSAFACLPHWRTTPQGKASATRPASQYLTTCSQGALASPDELMQFDFFVCCDTPRAAGNPVVHNICWMGRQRKQVVDHQFRSCGKCK